MGCSPSNGPPGICITESPVSTHFLDRFLPPLTKFPPSPWGPPPSSGSGSPLAKPKGYFLRAAGPAEPNAWTSTGARGERAPRESHPRLRPTGREPNRSARINHRAGQGGVPVWVFCRYFSVPSSAGNSAGAAGGGSPARPGCAQPRWHPGGRRAGGGAGPGRARAGEGSARVGR